jgi:hypothetical protein
MWLTNRALRGPRTTVWEIAAEPPAISQTLIAGLDKGHSLQ